MTVPGPPTAAAWLARGTRVRALGHQLFRIAEGASAGTPIVLVHGFPTCTYDFHACLPLLARRRRVLAIDLLGYGGSDKPWPHSYTIAEQTDLLEAWLALEGVARAHVVAHDMGTTVVQELLARRREGRSGVAPSSVLLLNGGIVVEKIRPILAQKLLRSRLVGPLAARLIGRRAFGRSLDGIAGKPQDPRELDALFALLTRDGGRRVYSGLIRYMDERVRHRLRWRGALLETPTPLRLVWGDRDPISVWGMVAEVSAHRPATDVVRLEGTGHYPQLEEPERVAAAALDWADRHDTARAPA